MNYEAAKRANQNSAVASARDYLLNARHVFPRNKTHSSDNLLGLKSPSPPSQLKHQQEDIGTESPSTTKIKQNQDINGTIDAEDLNLNVCSDFFKNNYHLAFNLILLLGNCETSCGYSETALIIS